MGSRTESSMFCEVFIAFTGIAIASGNDPVCRTVRERNQVSPQFARIVSHLIHSMTLQELRHHFKANAKAENGIPTINPNLTAEPRILNNVPDLPLNNSFNVFGHPALDALDSILSHMDDPDWGWRNAPILEHIVHEYHILATLTEVAKVYRRMSKPFRAKKLCGCLQSENGMIIQWLEAIDTILQGPINTSQRMQIMARYKVSEYAISQLRDGTLVQRPPTNLPLLDNEAAWDAWKESMSTHLTEDGVSNKIWLKNAAIYMYCKLKTE